MIGCAPALPRSVLPVALLGEPAGRASLATSVASIGQDEAYGLRLVEPPSTVEPPAPDTVIVTVVAARRALVAADAPRCLELLAGQELVTDSLIAGRRGSAARVLLVRIECHVALGNLAAGRVEANAMAALGLDLPEEGASATAESVVMEASKALATAPPLRLDIRARDVRASVALDGGPVVCSTPCTLRVLPGDHVLRIAADGRAEAHRRIAVTKDESIDVSLVPASPEIASRQWAARYAASSTADDAESVALLGLALKTRTLVVLSARPDAGGTKVRGTLVREGALAFRAEQVVPRGEPFGAPVDVVVRDLLVEGGLLEKRGVLQSPWFWITTAVVVAGAASAVTYGVLYEPDTRVEVRFQ